MGRRRYPALGARSGLRSELGIELRPGGRMSREIADQTHEQVKARWMPKKRLSALVTASALGIGLLGCSTSARGPTGSANPSRHACTLIGCHSGIYLYLPASDLSQPVSMCLGHRCTSRPPGESAAPVLSIVVPASGTGDVKVSVTVGTGSHAATRDIEAQTRPYRPNGSSCPPTCYVASLRLTTAGTLTQQPVT